MQQLIKQSTTALHPSDPTTSSSSIHHYGVFLTSSTRSGFTLSLKPRVSLSLAVTLVWAGKAPVHAFPPSLSNSELEFMALLSKRLRDNEQSSCVESTWTSRAEERLKLVVTRNATATIYFYYSTSLPPPPPSRPDQSIQQLSVGLWRSCFHWYYIWTSVFLMLSSIIYSVTLHVHNVENGYL